MYADSESAQRALRELKDTEIEGRKLYLREVGDWNRMGTLLCWTGMGTLIVLGWGCVVGIGMELRCLEWQWDAVVGGSMEMLEVICSSRPLISSIWPTSVM